MSDAPVFAGKPLGFDLNPVILSKSQVTQIQSTLSKILADIEAFTTTAVREPALLKQLGLPGDLPGDPTPLGIHIPFARFDVVLDGDQFWIYELNTDGTSGYNICEWLGTKAQVPKDKDPNYGLTRKVFDSLLAHEPRAHDIHLVDFRDVETSWEQKDLVRRWKEFGHNPRLTDPGMRTWVDGSLMYRRILSWQLRSRASECRPFLEDWAQKKIKVIGGWSSDVGMSKGWPIFLKTPQVPETRFADKAWAGIALKEKSNWVLKGILSYSGRSVFRGQDLSEDQWKSAVEAASRETESGRPWVAQKIQVPSKYEGKNLELGFFFLNGKPSGIMARWGSDAVISESSEEVMRPVQLD